MTIWLTVKDFAKKQQKRPVTIYRWIETNFVIELGFSINRDCTGHVKIGIPPEHPSYRHFL